MIKRQIFVITVFLSNIAFTAILPADTIESFRDITIAQEHDKTVKETLHNAATAHLVEKGLDIDVAYKRVANTLVHSELEAHNLTQKIVHDRQIGYDNLVRYVARAALYKKRVDLSDPAEISAMLQRYINT